MKLLLTTFSLLLTIHAIAANKTFQAIDTNGYVLFEIEAERVYAFSNGMARIQKLELINNEWIRGNGYINTKGEIVIPCMYDKTQDFTEDRAWVKKKDAETTCDSYEGEWTSGSDSWSTTCELN